MIPRACTSAKLICICELWGCDGCNAEFSSQPPKLACPNCGDEAIGPRENVESDERSQGEQA
jgi:rRNA maturation endonuclease Nob1